MSLDKAELATRIESEMVAQGATATGEHSWVTKLSVAVANAVIDEIHANAEVPVTSGSSAGTYNVE